MACTTFGILGIRYGLFYWWTPKKKTKAKSVAKGSKIKNVKNVFVFVFDSWFLHPIDKDAGNFSKSASNYLIFVIGGKGIQEQFPSNWIKIDQLWLEKKLEIRLCYTC